MEPRNGIWFTLVAALATALAIAGGAASAQQPTTPAATGAQAEVPNDYVIGPEDVLGVVFWREPDISGDVTVRPDGRITLPVIGEMQAAGVKPAVLQATIIKAAGKYLTDPNVAVVVRTINSRRIFVTGRVTTPGGHLLKGPLNVMQAIALAGGVTEYADSKNITILRNKANGQTDRFRFNYKDVARGKNLEQNIQLLPGDTVVVP
jgi:polysaccharide export outer membrane protein